MSNPAQTDSIGERKRGLNFLISLLLAALVWGVFAQTAGHDFIDYDDADYVYANPMVKRGLTWAGVKWAFSGAHADNWHPLTWLSHMLDCQLYKLHPAGHHLTNVILHTLTVLFLFSVLRSLTGARWRSAWVAALFAIHPLRVESVAWVAERKDVLSGLFFVLTVGAYARWVRRPDSRARYAWVVLWFVLGLLSKPMLVSVPVVLLLLDYWPLQRTESWRRLIIEKIPLAALAAISCGITLLAQTGAMRFGGSFAFPLRLANALVSCVTYLWQMIWPVNLGVLYPFPEAGLPKGLIAFAAIFLCAVSILAWQTRRSARWFLVGWLWYLVMLLPVLGLIQVGAQAHADRYTYLPQIGVYLIVSWLGARVCQSLRLSPFLIGTTAATIIVLLAGTAWVQTGYWQSSKTLWPHTIAVTGENALANYNLGTVWLHEGRVDEAIAYYQKAQRIHPDYANIQNNLGSALMRKGDLTNAIIQFKRALALKENYANAHDNLGGAYLQLGDLDRATEEYRAALKIEPNFAEANYSLGHILLEEGKLPEAVHEFQTGLKIKPAMAPAHFELGLALMKQNQISPALAELRESLQLDPHNPQSWITIADILEHQGDVPGAIDALQQTVKIAPDFAQAHNNLGTMLLQKGDIAGAIQQFQQAHALEPDEPGVENNLAWLLAVAPDAAQRNGPKAVELARRANDQTGHANPAMLNTLAAALAESGRFDEAQQVLEQAISLAQASGQTALAAQFESERGRFRAGVPLHR